MQWPTRYETPYIGPLELYAPYDPVLEIGALGQTPATATCPERPLWWLAAAFGAGTLIAFAATKKDKKRRGRIG